MRHNILVILFISLMCFLLSCSDSTESSTTTIAPVSNVTYEVGIGEILFKWQNPEIKTLAYVEISYADSEGKMSRVLVDGKLSQQLIYGFADNQPYEFKFLTYSTSGKASEPVIVTAQPKMPAYHVFNSRIKVAGNFGGVDVSWDNTYDEEFYIQLSYIDPTGKVISSEIAVDGNSEGSRFIPISGIQQTNLSVITSDIYGHKSAVNSVPYRMKEQGKFDRSVWKVMDFDSQEENDNGYTRRVTDMLDGDPTTFWHTKWNGATADEQKWPHYATFDLGRKVKINKIEIQNRIDANKAHAMLKDIEVQGSNVSAKGPWETFGTHTMPDNKVVQYITLKNPVEYRYVKLVCVNAGPGSDTHYAAVAEFALHGEDLVGE